MQPSLARNVFVVTGGPGSGKSTLIAALASRGYATSEEKGRAVIRDQRDIGGPANPWTDRQLYAELMLDRDIVAHRAAQETSGPVFFDRGIPDIVGYLRLEGLPMPPHALRAAHTFRYNATVFLAPFWLEIYETDMERKQSPEMARATCETMIETYAALGYDLKHLPLAPVDERLDFVLAGAGQG